MSQGQALTIAAFSITVNQVAFLFLGTEGWLIASSPTTLGIVFSPGHKNHQKHWWYYQAEVSNFIKKAIIHMSQGGFLVVCFSHSKLERPSVSRPRNDNKTSAIQRRSTKLNRMTCPYLIECLSRSSQLIFSNPLSRAGTFPFNDQSKNIQIFWLFDRPKTL